MVEDSRVGKHLMRVDKGWKEIMNLYPISKLGKIGALILKVGGSKEQERENYNLLSYDLAKI